jgi:hypothetical protein
MFVDPAAKAQTMAGDEGQLHLSIETAFART